MDSKYECKKCGHASSDKLEFYRIQLRALRLDSNKTAGKSRKSKTFCEPCVERILAAASVPGGSA